jgi:hypothetical protein
VADVTATVANAPGPITEGITLKGSGSDDTGRWNRAMTSLYEAEGGKLIVRPGHSGEQITLDHGDWLSGVYLEGHPGHKILQAPGAKWALRGTDAIGFVPSDKLLHRRTMGHPLTIDCNGQVGAGLLMDGWWASDIDVLVTNPASSGEWEYDDLGGIPLWSPDVNYQQGTIVYADDALRHECLHDNTLGIDPATDDGTHWSTFAAAFYPTSGVLLKGSQSRQGAYYNRIRAYVFGTDSPPKLLTGFRGNWLPTATYAQYDSAVDPSTGDIYVSTVGSNTNTVPLGHPSSWTQGTWHTSKTYAAGNAVLTWDGFRYDLWFSQGSQSGHNPLTDDGTNWRRAANGITLTGTTVLTTQRSNANHLYNVRTSNCGIGIAVLNGADVDIHAPEVSSNTIGIYTNGSGTHITKPYREACSIGVFLGHNNVSPVLDDEASSASTTCALVNVATRAKLVNLRNGKIGEEQFAVGTILDGQQTPIVESHVTRFVDTSPVSTYTFVGRKKVVDNGVKLQFLCTTGLRTLVDSSVAALSGSAGTVAANTSAFSDAAVDFTGKAGQAISIPGADVNDQNGNPGTLNTYIFSVTSTHAVVLAVLATHAVSGVSWTGGSALVLAGSANYTPAAGDLIEFVSDGGKWYEVSRSKRAA